jgi:hypothetical protein
MEAKPSAKAAQQIQRYSMNWGYEEADYDDTEGEWVRYEDHLASLRARDAEIEGLAEELEYQTDFLIADKYGSSSNPKLHAALIDIQGRLLAVITKEQPKS